MSLTSMISFKDDEIQKQARFINQLKEQLGEQDEALKANQVDTEKLQSQINSMQSESETSKTEVKEVLQALEELAVNYDQKLQEVETKTKDNDKLSDELSQKQVRCDFLLNRNYNKILASDWPSPAMTFAQIGQCNWTVRAIVRALEQGNCTFIFSLLRISG